MNVALFISCLNDTFFPRVGEAVVRVLRHFGCSVEFPADQTCCGQPAYNSGLHADARPVAEHFVKVFHPYQYIVTPSASCAAMVREHLPALLEHDPRARAVADRTHEFTRFLTHHLQVDLAAQLRFSGPITCHYPCHARPIYPSRELADLLTRAAGEHFTPPDQLELCCGFGGMFAVDQPEISNAMLTDKLADLQQTQAPTVISNEAGCNLHLAGGAHRRGLDLRWKHLAECLAESLDLMPPADVS